MARRTIKGEILSRLSVGPMSVADLERALPHFTRAQLLNAMGVLRTAGKVHIPGQRTGLRNPAYALGPGAGYRNMTREEVEERTYRIRMNPHLRPEWKPTQADCAAAWLMQPIQG
jgi:hypothetical protein